MTRVLLEASGLGRAEIGAALRGDGAVTLIDDDLARGDLRERIESLSPDVVAIEAEGDETLASLLPLEELAAWPPVMLIVAHADPAWASAAVRAGIRAVITREAVELSAAIAAVAAGFVVLHPETSAPLVPASHALATRNGQRLSQREIDVLRMMAEGLPNKAIGARLHISEHTVKFHVGSIFSKLHAGSRTEAVAVGARQGLVML